MKGKIYLTSNGITSENLERHFHENVHGEMACIITTASVGYKENDKHIPEIVKLLNRNGLRVNFIDLEYEDPKELMKYDLIYINGGNPFFLLKFMKEKKCKQILSDLLNEGKIIVGASAGSMVLTNNIKLVKELDEQMNEEVRLNDLNALNFIDLEMCPHIESFKDRYDSFLNKIEEYEKRNKIDIVRLKDGEAIYSDFCNGWTLIKNNC